MRVCKIPFLNSICLFIFCGERGGGGGEGGGGGGGGGDSEVNCVFDFVVHVP